MACLPNDQFAVGMRVDPNRETLNIAVWSTAADLVYQTCARVILYQILPGALTPDLPSAAVVTTLLNDTTADASVGVGNFYPALGVAARQGRVYLHHTYNNVQGVYNGVNVPEPNNHLSRTPN